MQDLIKQLEKRYSKKISNLIKKIGKLYQNINIYLRILYENSKIK